MLSFKQYSADLQQFELKQEIAVPKKLHILDKQHIAEYSTTKIAYAKNPNYTGEMHFITLVAGNQRIVSLQSFMCLVMHADPVNPARYFNDKNHSEKTITYNGYYYKFLNKSNALSSDQPRNGLSALQIHEKLRNSSNWHKDPIQQENIKIFFEKFMKKNPHAKYNVKNIFVKFLPEFVDKLPENVELYDIGNAKHINRLVAKSLITKNQSAPAPAMPVQRTRVEEKHNSMQLKQETKTNPVPKESDLDLLATLAAEKPDVEMVQIQSPSIAVQTFATPLLATTPPINPYTPFFFPLPLLVKQYPIQPKPIYPTEKTAESKPIAGPSKLGHSDRSCFKRRKLDDGTIALGSVIEEQPSPSEQQKVYKVR